MDFSQPRIMGILNITPDSFYAGSRTRSESEILHQAEKMLQEGADILDVGGYSSRPGAEDVPEEEEIARTKTALRLLHEHFSKVVISIDTFRSSVARIAAAEGASMINDISFGELDPAMLPAAASLQVPYIGMHMRGTPQTMNTFTTYENLVKDITNYFHQKIQRAQAAGINDIIIDPGFGFAKTIDQSFQLLNHLQYLNFLDRPILVGISRKSMIWKTLEVTANEALNGTTALHMAALFKGANILRVHDVKQATETIQLFRKLNYDPI